MGRTLKERQSPAPRLGMGATQLCNPHRRAFTVVRLINPRTVVVQEDQAWRTDNNGVSDQQEYRFACNPYAPEVTVTLRKHGYWVAKGEPNEGTPYIMGLREKYHDYSKTQ